ncbi:hypothetical protein Hanom_Chr15g01351871 [Helianthus anomalus]
MVMVVVVVRWGGVRVGSGVVAGGDGVVVDKWRRSRGCVFSSLGEIGVYIYMFYLFFFLLKIFLK